MAKEKQAMESRGFLKLINFMKRVDSDGIPTNGEEVAISPQKDGLVGCGRLQNPTAASHCQALRRQLRALQVNLSDYARVLTQSGKVGVRTG